MRSSLLTAAAPDRFDYDLGLPPEAVRARLAMAADRPTARYWWLPGTTQGQRLIGEVTANGFWWRMRHNERASFAPWLTGQIEPTASGSRVMIQLRSPFTIKARVVIGLAVATLGLLWAAVTPNPTLIGLVVAAAAISVAVLFPFVGTRLYVHERRLLREAFENTMGDQIRNAGKTQASA